MITLSICWKAIFVMLATFGGFFLLGKLIYDLASGKKYAKIVLFIFVGFLMIFLLYGMYLSFAEMFCVE